MSIPVAFLKKMIADQRQTRALADEIIRRMPQMIETKVSTAKKDISSQVEKKLEVLKESLDGIDNWVQD